MADHSYEEFDALMDAYYKAEDEGRGDVPYPKGLCTADWKARVHEVLEKIERQLAEHGLEIAQYDTKSDFYAWKIVKKT